MKKFKILLAIAVLATVFINCDTAEDILPTFNITRVVSSEMPLDVMANPNGDCIDFTETTTFDLKSDPEINENYSKVTALEINSISWGIKDFTGGDGVFMDGGLLKVGGTSFDIGNVDLKAADTANDMFVITDVTKLASIASEMLSTGSISIELESTSGGNCENDFAFTLNLKQDVKVTVQPL
jgi:hypothetical protein